MKSINKFRILRNSSQGSRLPYELLDLIENELIESEKYLQQKSREWLVKLMIGYKSNQMFNTDDEFNIMRDNPMAYVIALEQIINEPDGLHSINLKHFVKIYDWTNLITKLIDNDRYDIANLLLKYNIVKTNIFVTDLIIKLIDNDRYDIANSLLKYDIVKTNVLKSIILRIDDRMKNIIYTIVSNLKYNSMYDNISDIDRTSIYESLDIIEENEKYYEILSKEKIITKDNFLKFNNAEVGLNKIPIVSLVDKVESQIIKTKRLTSRHPRS